MTEAFQLATRPHCSSSLTCLTHHLQTSWMDCRVSSACRHRPHRGSTALQQKQTKKPHNETKALAAVMKHCVSPLRAQCGI